MADTTAGLLQTATEHHQAGRLGDAEALYRDILTRQPTNSQVIHRLAVIRLQTQKPQEAIALLDKALQLNPTNATAFLSKGEALNSVGDFVGAEAAYKRAIELNSTFPTAYFNLGNAQDAQGHHADAIASYKLALAQQPNYADAILNLGNALFRTGDFDTAAAQYRLLLQHKPDSAGAWSNLGSTFQAQSKFFDAIQAYQRAIELDSSSAAAHCNLGTALVHIGDMDDALTALKRALEIKPDFPEALFAAGNALRGTQQLHEAMNHYCRAIQIRPTYTDAWINLGNALHLTGEHQQALGAYMHAVKISPDRAEIHNNIGMILRLMGRIDEAIASFHLALATRPGWGLSMCNLGNAQRDAGQVAEAMASFSKLLERQPNDTVTHSNLVYTMYFSPDYSGAQILTAHRRWNDLHTTGLQPIGAGERRKPSDSPRLRIGYVGADFREHCQSFFTIPLLKNHDHTQFEIFVYADVGKPDSLTTQHQQYTDHWRSTCGLTDEQLARMIYDDRIDLLIDLTMHMARGRLLAFARRPSPIQIAWLAYPGTTGLSTMDYRLTDPHLDPLGADELYSERSIRLPETFWCYDPLTDKPDVNKLPAIKKGSVTFGCLNNFCKTNPAVFELFSQVMGQVPGSRLLLMSGEGAHRERVIDLFSSHGITRDRIEFLKFQPRGTYLETYHRIDLGLDTFPYNGHTTSLDSLWMGVPVVTLVGKTAVGRAGLSQLTNLGMAELAATKPADFVRIAVDLARDLPRLSQLRADLRSRLMHSPLMDGARFARNVETAYRQLWHDYAVEG